MCSLYALSMCVLVWIDHLMYGITVLKVFSKLCVMMLLFLNFFFIPTWSHLQAGAVPSSSSAPPSGPPLLSVDTRRLRGEDELRRIFGSEVVAMVEREGAAEAAAAATGRRR
jgi:hypothetical protein